MRVFNGVGEIKSQDVGTQMVWEMRPEGGGAYMDGKIRRPSTGKVYNSKMTMNGDTLKVSGCIGPICKGQNWSRLK
jgi:uncharacterized protein (DUF2147 family)